jgi:hypothetical protein
MKRVLFAMLLATALTSAVAAQAGGPVTKQNGATPVISAFTSICAVQGFAGYGFCGGDVTKFSDVAGKLNAVQSKAGRYNLDFSFKNLTPAVEYRLWGTRDGFSWSVIGTAAASESGSVRFSFQTTEPAGLGFDLNTVNEGNITVMTSWWSGQKLALNGDGTLSATG